MKKSSDVSKHEKWDERKRNEGRAKFSTQYSKKSCSLLCSPSLYFQQCPAHFMSLSIPKIYQKVQKRFSASWHLSRTLLLALRVHLQPLFLTPTASVTKSHCSIGTKKFNQKDSHLVNRGRGESSSASSEEGENGRLHFDIIELLRTNDERYWMLGGRAIGRRGRRATGRPTSRKPRRHRG